LAPPPEPCRVRGVGVDERQVGVRIEVRELGRQPEGVERPRSAIASDENLLEQQGPPGVREPSPTLQAGRPHRYPRAVRVYSGIQPTGRKHLGNYLGAIRHYVTGQQ